MARAAAPRVPRAGHGGRPYIMRDVEVAFCPVDCVLESASNKNGTSPYAHFGTTTSFKGPRLGSGGVPRVRGYSRAGLVRAQH